LELPDSYEAIHERAVEAVNPRDPSPSIAEFKRLVERLLSLPPKVREWKPSLNTLLELAAIEYVVLLRWAGRNAEALDAIRRFRERLPRIEPDWIREEALNRIDSGDVSAGLDALRALLLKHPDRSVREVLAYELLGAGEYAEAMQVATPLLPGENLQAHGSALSLLLTIAVEKDDRKAVMRYTDELGRLGNPPPFRVCEWLAARGYWDDLEPLLKGVQDEYVKQVYRGERRRAQGKEAEARKMWESVRSAGDQYDAKVDLYAYVRASLMLNQADDEVLGYVTGAFEERLTDSTALLALLAALAQTGRIEEAPQAIRQHTEPSRLIRPYWKRLPYSYWLRLRCYPMPDDAVEALRPYFVTEPAGPTA